MPSISSYLTAEICDMSRKDGIGEKERRAGDGEIVEG